MAKPVISYETIEEKPEDTDDKVTTNYKYKDSDISKKDYGKVEKKLLFAAKDIVLSDDEYSEYMTKGGSFDPSGNVSMTYEEAVSKLK